MGIARFYRWLSERYPLINENISADQIPDFDNLYLDMNGIVHNCSHNNTGGLCHKDEADVFVEAFKYIVRLVHIIRPKRLLYMAVDGCAPRAKMNQQRSRRFRAANDAREDREKRLEMGEELTGKAFDSNCITPGTEFMSSLTEQLRFFVQKQIQEDPLWQGMEVILSGPDVPGEGEHKIMDYIRTAKSQPGYDPNTRHCLYGLDADLIMLALASHEPHFALLREEVVFGRQATKSVEQRMMSKPDKFQLLHISLLREYLVLEFQPALSERPQLAADTERIIDDFILFCVLVGNDFLPHLPFAEISEGGLDDFFSTYKEHLRSSTDQAPWLVRNCGEIAFEQLRSFFLLYAPYEEDRLSSAIDDETFMLGRRRLVGPEDAPDPVGRKPEQPLEVPPNSDFARILYYDVKFEIDVQSHDGLQQQRKLFASFAEGLQWVLYYYFRGPDKASWSWYYPYYHAPMIYDIVNWDELAKPGISFDVGKPFLPFQQLMAVLPAHSKSFLPKCYQWLFDSSESPILDFYPQKFEIDIDGVKVPWGGVTMIPWIDPSALLSAMSRAESAGPELTDTELKRNSFGEARTYRYNPDRAVRVQSTLPKRFQSLERCPVEARRFDHPTIPEGGHFACYVLPGCDLLAPGFPTLKRHRLTTTTEMGVKVFQFESRGKSLIVHLHPEGPVVPDETAIRDMLKKPCAQVDYPFVHGGKVVAVHTAKTIFREDGRKETCSSREHADWVQQLTADDRRRGLLIEFPSADGGSAGDTQRQQAVAEVRALESAYVDSQGQAQYRFKRESEYRLLHLINAEGVLPKTGHAFSAGAPVVCTAKDSICFGHVGLIVRESAAVVETPSARFELPSLSSQDNAKLQQQLQQLAEKQHERVKWHDLKQAVQLAQVDFHVATQLLGTLHFRGADHVREDIGMNICVDPSAGRPVLCLPTYSIKRDRTWYVSDHAVAALKEYAAKFPSLVAVLKSRRKMDRDLEARFIFPDSRDMDYDARQLVKYCNGCAFKKLRLVQMPYMALDRESVLLVVDTVDKANNSAKADAQANTELVHGANDLMPIEEARCKIAELKLAQGQIQIGQRGRYAKPGGRVSCGAGFTVVAVYGTGAGQMLDVVLDTDSFGADDLQGRAPPMRGMRIAASDMIPFPMITDTKRADQSVASPVAAEQKDMRDATATLKNLLAQNPVSSVATSLTTSKQATNGGVAKGNASKATNGKAGKGANSDKIVNGKGGNGRSNKVPRDAGIAARGNGASVKVADENAWMKVFEDLLKVGSSQ
eukprot:TRINITY_DN18383_c0_g4_i1.p1 TRINITY_DN18383_c0_g4~~TRINITY_DN18383_c0_g4_i1.p1  ORF type:complete len:1271 (+),score=234.93 TRINITY_DN18383_c0_g4_i1:70-3882(+)